MTSNSTILFLKGLHILHRTAEIENVNNLALIGVAGPEDSKIQCEGTAGFYFRQLIPGNLTISNLLFSNCGGEIIEGLPCGTLILDTVLHLNMTNVLVVAGHEHVWVTGQAERGSRLDCVYLEVCSHKLNVVHY